MNHLQGAINCLRRVRDTPGSHHYLSLEALEHLEALQGPVPAHITPQTPQEHAAEALRRLQAHEQAAAGCGDADLYYATVHAIRAVAGLAGVKT